MSWNRHISDDNLGHVLEQTDTSIWW